MKIDNIRNNEKLNYIILILPAAVVIFIISIIPLLSIGVTSFLKWEFTDLDNAKFIGFENFIYMFKDKRFLGSLSAQAIVSIITVILQIAGGLFFAMILNGLKGIAKNVRGLVVLPFVLPPVVVALTWKTLFTPSISPINEFMSLFGIKSIAWFENAGTAITAITVADAWNTFPFTVILCLAALQGISLEIYESAAIDGARKLQEIYYITLPMIKWSIVLSIMLRLIDSLKAFPLIFIMTGGGPGSATEVTNYYAYMQAFQYSNIGYGSSISFIVLVATIILSLFISRMNKSIYES